MAAEASSFPLSEFIGLSIERRGPGHTVATLDANQAHHNPHGFVHGATIFTMVDTAMGAAVMSLLGEGQRCSTIELQVRFLRPHINGVLRADTTVVKPGRQVMHLESKVTDAGGRLIATATASFAVIAA